jgi:hypothetical protein
MLRIFLIYFESSSKAALGYSSEVWIVNKRSAKKLEATQMNILKPLLGLTRLDC